MLKLSPCIEGCCQQYTVYMYMYSVGVLLGTSCCFCNYMNVSHILQHTCSMYMHVLALRHLYHCKSGELTYQAPTPTFRVYVPLFPLQDEQIVRGATQPMYLKCDLKTFDLSSLGTKFDVILVEPPLEEYQRKASGITFNWTPFEWEDVSVCVRV